MKRLTECRITIHDQVPLLVKKATLIVGQHEGHRFHPRFIRVGLQVREVDAAGFQLHDKEKVELREATLCSYFHGRKVDRSHHVPVRFQEGFPGSCALALRRSGAPVLHC